MCLFKDRILRYIEHEGISIREFERKCGFSNGYFNKIKDFSTDKVQEITRVFPNLNYIWVLTGETCMLNSDMAQPNEISQVKIETRPRIPYTAAAGSLTSAVEGVTSEQCEHIPRISFFPEYDFTIIIKGDSMEPKYEGGDEVACKRIDNTSFIQWGKPHVLDTAQGILIKRTYEDGDKIRCVSYNPEYPDFSIDKNEIYSMSLVVGLVRL
jgi:repressor LexA